MSCRCFALLVLAAQLSYSAVNATAVEQARTVKQPASWRSCSDNAAFIISAVDLEPSSVIPPGGQLSMVIDGTNSQQVTAGVATISVWYYGVRVLTASDTLCTAAATLATDVVSPHSNSIQHTSATTGTVGSTAPAAAAAEEATSKDKPSSAAINRIQRSLLSSQTSTQLTSSSLKTAAASSSSSSRSRLWQLLIEQGSLPTASNDATCTMSPGPLHLTHTATLPGIAPRGSYSMRLAAADMVTGQQIMCVDVWFKVG